MKYLVIGAGGTGGSIAAAMAETGIDVTVAARGAHLAAIREKGLFMETTKRGNYTVYPVSACTLEENEDVFDVIFLCVKGYSVEEVLPFIKKMSHRKTVLIPLLNIYGLGGKLQERLKGIRVTDGCIYIAAEIKSPGVIVQKGDISRVVFGTREGSAFCPELTEVAFDLERSGIDTVLSSDIRRDALRKYTFVSAMAACGQYYDADAAAMQREGEERDMFVALVRELEAIAAAMGINFGVDITSVNLKILDGLSPAASTSMQRDIRNGRPSEIDGLVFEVLRMGKKCNVSTPTYEKAAGALSKFA